jgi:ribosome maturation factor RimP
MRKHFEGVALEILLIRTLKAGVIYPPSVLQKSFFGGIDLQKMVEQLQKALEALLEELGYELYELKYIQQKSKKTLRVFIDHPQRPISIKDCEEVSRHIGPLIDEQELLKGSYYLEVSSPGVERELRNERDFKRFVGETVKIITKEPVEKRTVFIGKLTDFDLENKELEVLERDSNRLFKIKYANVKKAQLYLEV